MTEATNTCKFREKSLARCLAGIIPAAVILLMPLNTFAQADRIEMSEGKTCYVSDKYLVLVAKRPVA